MEPMETPLDVLSRAASMVETDEANRDLAYKRGIDHRDSPNKELPTKLSKYDRMKDRHDLPGTLNFDQEHLAKLNSKKCAGTQTSFSGFVGDRYLPEGSVRHEPYSVTPRCATPHEVRQPSLSPLHRRSPPPAYPHGDASQNIPLNLSIGNSTGENHKLSPLRQLLRPSVITCAPAGNKFSVTDHSQSFSAAIRREINSVGGCDPAIEEHFRRSLGKDYPECLPSKSSSRSSSPLVQAASPGSQSEKAVSITGSVDDHFAKSLGDSTWSQIKAKNDPVPFDMFSGSVDDHFAKALGDTWLRIKAEKETDPSSSTCSSQPASPRQHPSIIST
ncbi:transcription cofactor vestigial-like protein 4 isoform X2 [Liolophura sinensis]|uniref:transcription cofactor vestigial-like protein 4 isoform X2 n=1 Tax=Liolophura sinensis TaxID=3198878 RepID=UPI00315987BD